MAPSLKRDYEREIWLSPVGFLKEDGGSYQPIPNLYIHEESGTFFIRDDTTFSPANLELE